MKIDCHFHLEPRLLSVPDLLVKMDQAQVDKLALISPMIDPFPEPPVIMVRLLQWMLKRSRFRPLAYHFCADFTPQGDIRILFQKYSIYAKPDNSSIFQTIDQYPDRFLGWLFINPASDQDIISEIDQWIDHPNCIGIKVHPFWHRYAPVRLTDAARIAVQKGKPMLMHAGFNDHGDFLSLIKAVPDLKLILAHAAFPRYQDNWAIMRSHPNVFVDISQTAYVNEHTIQEVVNTLGYRNCLFGTDGPYGSTDSDGQFSFDIIIKQIETLFPDNDIQEAILGRNFADI
ncbi:MAG: Amidohydrolase 2 [Candidatus Magnetoglobus multicellularis str. Araruama]|uniref:Amidohydrolase 2 n=1 Tax=Candidatus Magnetoglobus multicellularis str. Araruama TaxID=890399 RepID=A0A1V1PHJ4_9BACT|nr:MAG: Amidohydrolase 2 [Candidatus Magnetoglobus multicellularis str. Araruama]